MATSKQRRFSLRRPIRYSLPLLRPEQNRVRQFRCENGRRRGRRIFPERFSILAAYAIGMILLLPVTGVAWLVERMFPGVRLLLQPVGNVTPRLGQATRAAISVLPRSRAAIVIFVFVISCGAYLALRPREPSQADDRLSTSRTYNTATK